MQENDTTAASLSKTGRASSPAATGGAGTLFEQHVAAYWLAQLLVRGIPPILIDTIVAEVHFQTEHLGWQTDDFLIVCEDLEGATKKLAGQVKRSFTVSAANQDFKQVILDFWEDFGSGDRFSPADDRLVLVTLHGTETLLKHFVGLLDCARAARDGAEFEQRLATKGFISNKAVHYCGELQKIIGGIEGQPVTQAVVWPFLRVLHVLSLDLASSTRQTEALVKSLLAYTTPEGGANGAANASWHALLALASNAMPDARSLKRIDLPEELRQRHAPVGTTEQHVLRALKDHTDLILRGIRSTIGQDFHLERAALVQEVLGALETAQVVLVSGPAGSGKSAIGKDVVSFLSRDHFVFSFRSEEFAQPHFDATLKAGQIPANGTTISAILAAQERKIVLVESVERLLEKTTRDAFSDLMTLAKADRSMRIVLTCRDYSIDQVRSSFLEPAAIKTVVVNVPPLEDAELVEIEVALPALAYPLKNPALRNILRNPYFLDKALKISWTAERPVPESERDFRALFWREIVRGDNRVPGSMARRRVEIFQEIAVRRARALSAYVPCDDLDQAVIESLRQDSILGSPDERLLLVATTHDVLEDWAILQWLEEQYVTGEESFKSLSAAVGTHPAVRRSYRKWVAELLERNPAAADRLFRAAISETEISGQFRDDTLVSLLKAPSFPDFLMRHEARLLADDGAILKRVIHLLRLACVTRPDWLSGAEGHEVTFNVRDGPAWAPVLGLVHGNLDSFTPQESLLLLGLIEDAVRNISREASEPDGAEFVAGISHWLLPRFDNYKSEREYKRVLQVLAKIPKADPVRFEAVLRDPIADAFREILLTGVDGMLAARDLPDLVISVATGALLATEDDLCRKYGPSVSVELHFGIKDGLSRYFYPTSALRGPWISLFHFHPCKAIDFFINVFNHSADWYALPRVSDSLEPAWEIELTFADGMTCKQWGNPRLWNLYRGASVGPYVLQCLLMALEKWLLEVAGNYPEQLDSLLVQILRRSQSAALAAVVSSVATAHPHASGEALLALLSAPDYVVFDRGRMAVEVQASALLDTFPTIHAMDRIYQQQRKMANCLPHRIWDLETAILNLQLGPMCPRVHAILDQHLAALPPQSEQDESDLAWRLAIHRMDLRQYAISSTNEPKIPDTGGKADKRPKGGIRLELKAPDPDVQAMAEESSSRFSAMNARLGLRNWAYEIFKRQDSDTQDPSMWEQRLLEAMLDDAEDENNEDPARGGPGIVAAVCICDHWGEMSVAQRDWCLERACSEVLTHANEWSDHERIQRYDMLADRACAWTLPLVLTKPLPSAKRLIVQSALVVALTHSNEEVRQYAAEGVGQNLWSVDRALALRCVNAIAMEAGLIEDERRAWYITPHSQGRQMAEVLKEAAETVRQAFLAPDEMASDFYEALDIDEWFGADANERILAILLNAPSDPVAVAAFVRAAQTLVGWWDADDERDREDGRGERGLYSEVTLSKLLQKMVMLTSAEAAKSILAPILGAIDSYPERICWIVEGLAAIEDRRPNTLQYWYLWELFADGVKRAEWVPTLNDEHPCGGELVSAVFLATGGKDDVRHWRSLEGHAHRVDALFEALPASSIVLDAYACFLYHVGEQSLPVAFGRVANSLKRGASQAMLSKTNTVFVLEVLLQRHVYGRPLELKRDPAIREAVLFLLDLLVEMGSSEAFRMRDDFVTPSQH